MLTQFFRKFIPWSLAAFAFGVVVTAALALHLLPSPLDWVGKWLDIGTACSWAVGGILTYVRTHTQFNGEKASIAFKDLVSAPNYAEQTGFIHQVEADLKKALDLYPNAGKIVVFIDDLDRCAPTKVAQVAEGLNLFLTGDFRKCVFVLGMDPEIVASALQKAHEDLVKQLPKEIAVPLGWRFMDKFIQLPFTLPQADTGTSSAYVASLFRPPRDADHDTPPKPGDGAKVDAVAPHGGNGGVGAPQKPMVPDPKHLQTEVDAMVARFSDADSLVRRAVEASATRFSTNPRELKRFVNTARFYLFLAATSPASAAARTPNLDQLLNWIDFLLRWPDAARWLGRPDLNEQADGTTTRWKRVGKLPPLATTANWTEEAARILDLDLDRCAWIKDTRLQRFLSDDTGRGTQAVSAASGGRFW